MHASIGNAGRTTHLKIVVVALVAAIVVVAVGINARTGDTGNVTARIKTDGRVLKAGKPATYTDRDASAIR